MVRAPVQMLGGTAHLLVWWSKPEWMKCDDDDDERMNWYQAAKLATQFNTKQLDVISTV